MKNIYNIILIIFLDRSILRASGNATLLCGFRKLPDIARVGIVGIVRDQKQGSSLYWFPVLSFNALLYNLFIKH